MSGWDVLGALGCPYFHQPHLFEVCDSICDALYFTSTVLPFDNVNSGQMFESLPTWTRMPVTIPNNFPPTFRASPAVLSMWSCENIFHIQV